MLGRGKDMSCPSIIEYKIHHCACRRIDSRVYSKSWIPTPAPSLRCHNNPWMQLALIPLSLWENARKNCFHKQILSTTKEAGKRISKTRAAVKATKFGALIVSRMMTTCRLTKSLRMMMKESTVNTCAIIMRHG